jgi:2-succinyl-5-enolpyruvyl-6-hydroxy-3-cyclohexene-1-carboxylate synthase
LYGNKQNRLVKTSKKKNIQILTQLCVDFGMKYLVCSPGSRNAPFVIACNNHPAITCIVIPDERSAAFYALGISQASHSLVGMVCTSGSAALNYYPAIAEAFYQQVPLLVFTADRPEEWVNQGDGQTIDQVNVFSNHIRFSCSFSDKRVDSNELWFLEREFSKACSYANGNVNVKGPVHINLPFEEPLYVSEEIERIVTNPIILEQAKLGLTQTQKNYVSNKWNTSKRKMILVGQMEVDFALENCLVELAKDSSVLVMVENTSNLVNRNFIQCIDRTLESIPKDKLLEFAPDLLIVLGGAIVSKKIKSFLRTNKATNTWRVGIDFPFMDTYQALTHTFPIAPFDFLKEIEVKEAIPLSNYRDKWKQMDYLAQDKGAAFIAQSEFFSDLKVFSVLMDVIPENTHLHLANSSVVRYAQLFNPIKGISVWCNRGTSGIDGSTSTAAGHAYVHRDTYHTLLTGDISFFYDSNAFFNKLKLPNLRIFLINNAGGGIFKIIPGPDTTEELDDFFVFNHSFSAEYICKAFGVNYYSARSQEQLESQLDDFYSYSEDGHISLLEIFTDASQNDSVLKAYFNSIS